ncbi:single-stranded DNA-binding protein [Mycoplasmopsis columboralis]|uniref:Single-stranded DNA-binding protein n=1 Tax=Mycoplasmopsis columboralis TaxID=171282 RepID=A0A449B6J6_9BACT|nr:single-stranded DNA-binding protein [Mycoplasmopsis columboralis]VEU76226.1 single-stranded DNA-binding protein [Mycoplasmopsis columboralis]
MNKIILSGRLSYMDYKIKPVSETENKKILNFSLVNSEFTKKDNESEPMYFNCIVFGSTAELINKHFQKGDPILINGSLNSFKGKDKKLYTTVVVEEFDFMETKTQKEFRKARKEELLARKKEPSKENVHSEEEFLEEAKRISDDVSNSFEENSKEDWEWDM